jgi:hypothetical protein
MSGPRFMYHTPVIDRVRPVAPATLATPKIRASMAPN